MYVNALKCVFICFRQHYGAEIGTEKANCYGWGSVACAVFKVKDVVAIAFVLSENINAKSFRLEIHFSKTSFFWGGFIYAYFRKSKTHLTAFSADFVCVCL